MKNASILALGICAACTRGAAASPPSPTEGEAPSASVPEIAADSGRAPLDGVPWQIDVEANGKKLGSISIPVGAREPRPILVALHGGGDRPGWACGEWRAVADAYPFIVCPRGQGTSEGGLYWSTPAKTKEALDALLAVAHTRFADWLADTPIVLAGFSMGATQAMLLAREDPKRYPRVVLAENAYDPTQGTAFAASYSGERAAFLCTTVACGPTYRRIGEWLAKRGVSVHVNIAGTNAHGMWDVSNKSMRRDWPWLVEGLAGWEGYASHRLPPDVAPPGTTLVFDAP